MNPCVADGCEWTAQFRFCKYHANRIAQGRDREADLMPKCSVCGTTLREPAPKCGLCILDEIEAA